MTLSFIIKIKLSLALLLITTALRAETYQLFVLAGQSNMQGYQSDARAYPADPKQLDPKIPFFWKTHGSPERQPIWETLQAQPGRFAAGHFGPEVTFGRALAVAGLHPAIFKYTAPGTRLSDHWKKPGENGLYDDMMQQLKTAVSQLQSQGHTVNLSLLAWLQGESDADTPQLAAAYGERLNLLVTDFRKQTGNPQLPIIVGMDDESGIYKNNPAVLESQKLLAKTDPHVTVCSLIGLPKADVTHLTPLGNEYLGKRLFDAYKKLTAAPKPVK